MTNPSSGDIVVNLDPIQIRITPLGTWKHAESFLTAAQLLMDQQQRVSSVATFLFCRSIELSLKAFLLARGRDLENVRSFRHDLVKLLVEAHATGLDVILQLSGEERQAVVGINVDYHEHRLAYFDLFLTLLRDESRMQLQSAAVKLLAATKAGCLAASDGQWNPIPSSAP